MEEEKSKQNEAVKEKLEVDQKLKSERKDGHMSDNNHSLSNSDLSLSFSCLPLSNLANDNISLQKENTNSDDSSISENIKTDNSENDRSFQEIDVLNIPLECTSLATELSNVLLPLSDNNSIVNSDLIDKSQNISKEMSRNEDALSSESIKSDPFQDLSSITLRSERIKESERKTSPTNKVEQKNSEINMPFKVLSAQNSTDVENNSSNHSSTNATEYKQFNNVINLGAFEYQSLLSEREEQINRLTEALEKILTEKNNLLEQVNSCAQEIEELKKQLVKATTHIKEMNYNNKVNGEQVLNQSTLNTTTYLNFDLDDSAINESLILDEKKNVELKDKINLIINKKVEECKLAYESELKKLRDLLDLEKISESKLVTSYKNTEDSISSLPSCENNDKILTDLSISLKQESNDSFVINDEMLNEIFNSEELNINSDLKSKILSFVQNIVGKYKTAHQSEIKILKDELENEKQQRNEEIDKLRQLLENIKCGSIELTELKDELHRIHQKEMEELRRYFEQRCSEIEKHYSEEINSYQNRKSSSSSVSDLESEVCSAQIGPGGDASNLDLSKTDINKLRHDLQNKYHAELEILQDDYENRLDELKVNHENKIQELEQKHKIVVDALKSDLINAQKATIIAQEVANSGDFEITDVVQSYERRLQEQIRLAKIDHMSALEQQIQTIVSSSDENIEWPPELLEIRNRLTKHWNKEIQELKLQHADEIERLKEEHEKNLNRCLERQKRNMHKNEVIDFSNELEASKKVILSFKHIILELVKFIGKCEVDLNNTLSNELVKYGFDKDVSNSSISSCENLENLTSSPQNKRVHFAPDVTPIINLINESSLDCLDSSMDASVTFCSQLDVCLSKLKSEANAILSKTLDIKSKSTTDVSVQNTSLNSTPTTKSKENIDLNFAFEQAQEYIKGLESEKQILEVQLEEMLSKQEVLVADLDNAKRKINDLVESGRREIISEGYGENDITGSTTLGKRIVSSFELQEKARNILSESDNISTHLLLQLIEELCSENDRLVGDAKTDHDDLVRQIDAADKKLRATMKFLEDQAIERESERDEASKEITILREQLRENEKTRASCERINKEVENLEAQMQDMTVLLNERDVRNIELENELKEAVDKVLMLREIVKNFESQINEKNKTEIDLRNIVTHLEEKLDLCLKENEELKNSFISAQVCQKESQYKDIINKLESENQKLRVSSELIGPDGVLKQVKTQLNEIEKTLEKRTKDLEVLHVMITNPYCSSPSEDMSIRDQIRPTSSNEDDSDLPLEQLARLKDKLLRHARAEDTAIKRIRDLEMQLCTSKQEHDEMQTERDILQDQLSEQLVLITSLQHRLNEQRLRVESVQKQSNASFEQKFYELTNEIQELKDTIQNRDSIIQNLKTHAEEKNKRLVEQQKQINEFSKKEQQKSEKYQKEINKLRLEIETLNKKLYESDFHQNGSNKSTIPTTATLTSEFIDSLLADKNADIDRLQAKLNQIENELKFYASLNLTKEQLIEFSNLSNTVKWEREPDGLRRQAQKFESTPISGIENLDFKPTANETVIDATFRDSKCVQNASEISSIDKYTPSAKGSGKGSGDTVSRRVHFHDESELMTLQAVISKLQFEIKQKDDTIDEYKNNLEDLRRKLEFSSESSQEKSASVAENLTLASEKKILQVDLADVKMKLYEKSNKIECLEKEIERRDKLNLNLAKDKRKLENDIKELERRINELNNVDEILSSKNKEIYKLEEQLAALNASESMESLKQSLLEKESEINLLKKQIVFLENNLEGKFKEIEDCCANYKKANSDLQDKTKAFKLLEEKNKRLESQYQDHITSFNKKEAEFNTKMVEYERKITNLEGEIQKKTETIKTLPNTFALEIHNLHKCIEEKERILTQKSLLIEELNKEIHHLQDLVSEKDKIINQMTLDSNSLHVALEAIQSKIQESGNVIDLKKRLREEQNISKALYEELKCVKKNLEQFQLLEESNTVESLLLLKESLEREKQENKELKASKDALLLKVEKLSEKLREDHEKIEKYKRLNDEEKLNYNFLQEQDAKIIESMRHRLETLSEHYKKETEQVETLKKLLDEQKINANVIQLKDTNTIETLKVKIDELLKRENDFQQILNSEKRIREELERQLLNNNFSGTNNAETNYLFGKYLKLESHRKALIFQKSYLLTLLNSSKGKSKTKSNKPINKFRSAVYVLISIQRMQYIVRRWHTGRRIGGSVISKRPIAPTNYLNSSPKRMLTETPKIGDSPPCRDQSSKQCDLPLGTTIQESMILAPLEAPALLSRYIERFDNIQQRLGLTIQKADT